MAALIQILVLTGFLCAGMLLKLISLAPPPRATDVLIKAVLWVLLALMGFRLGNSPDLVDQLGRMGLMAGATAAFALAGTLCCIWLLYAAAEQFSKTAAGKGHKRDRQDSLSRAKLGFANFRAPGILLAVVLAGIALGLLSPMLVFDFDRFMGWVLNALLFMIGVQFAQSGLSLKSAFLRIDTLIIPLGTIIGTLAGGLFVALLFRMSAGKAMALAAGFGWYTLSGVLITNLGDPALGSTAFLANMIRESLALVLIPLLARSSRPFTAIGLGAATSMDVTLPLIEQCAGAESVPVSFASGAILSLLVPILVPLFYGLG